MRKEKRGILGVVLAIAVALTGFSVPQMQSKAAEQAVTLSMKDNQVPVCQAGETRKWTFTVSNHTDKKVENVVVMPELGDTADDWPFQTDYQSYKKEIGTLEAREEKDVTFEFTVREDAPTTRYTLQFAVCADDMEKQVKKFYVNTTAKPEETGSSQNEQSSGGDIVPMAVDGGGFSSGEAAYAGGGSGDSSVPRVIVTGFSTDPAEVRAGSNFTLFIHLKNTSKTTKVKNMLFDLSAPTEGADEQTMAPAFLPASGSSSIYLDGIKANGSADISIQLNAKSDLLQKPYSIELSMKYEDKNGMQIESASSISIPIKQDARFELSEFEINPTSIAVGEEANVMCNLYNLGRIKLYNVKTVFEGNCIEKEEVFVGNVESGTSASIDAMLEAKAETEGPEKVTLTLTYEDESGNSSEMQKELELEVIPQDEGEDMMPEEVEEEGGGLPVIPIIILAAAAIAAIVIIIILKKKKKQKMQNEEEELLDELVGPSEDECQ